MDSLVHVCLFGNLSLFEMVHYMVGGVAAILGVIGLFCYVSKTNDIWRENYDMAQASNTHNEIITRPAITAYISTDPDATAGRPCCRIRTRVKNHSAIHAHVRVRLTYFLRNADDTSRNQKYEIASGPYGGEVWGFPACAELHGNTELEHWKALDKKSTDRLLLQVSVEASPFQREDWKATPDQFYVWKDEARQWVPHPNLRSAEGT